MQTKTKFLIIISKEKKSFLIAPQRERERGITNVWRWMPQHSMPCRESKLLLLALFFAVVCLLLLFFFSYTNFSSLSFLLKTEEKKKKFQEGFLAVHTIEFISWFLIEFFFHSALLYLRVFSGKKIKKFSFIGLDNW